MVVTVTVTGIPRHTPLETLGREFNVIFDTDEIGSFRVRELTDAWPGAKRRIALDFSNGYDAMSVQELLDGREFRLSGGVICCLKARLLAGPDSYNSHEDSMDIVSSSNSSFHRRDVGIKMDIPDDVFAKANHTLDCHLQILKKQQEVLKAERKVLKQKGKLEKEYKMMDKCNSEHEMCKTAEMRGIQLRSSPLTPANSSDKHTRSRSNSREVSKQLAHYKTESRLNCSDNKHKRELSSRYSKDQSKRSEEHGKASQRDYRRSRSKEISRSKEDRSHSRSTRPRLRSPSQYEPRSPRSSPKRSRSSKQNREPCRARSSKDQRESYRGRSPKDYNESYRGRSPKDHREPYRARSPKDHREPYRARSPKYHREPYRARSSIDQRESYRLNSPKDHREPYRARSPKDHKSRYTSECRYPSEYRSRSPRKYRPKKYKLQPPEKLLKKLTKDQRSPYCPIDKTNSIKQEPISPYYARVSSLPETYCVTEEMNSKIEQSQKPNDRSIVEDQNVTSTSAMSQLTNPHSVDSEQPERNPRSVRKFKIALQQVLLELELQIRKDTFNLPISRSGKQSLSKAVQEIVICRFASFSLSWWNGRTADELVAFYRTHHSLEDDKNLVKKLVRECKEFVDVDDKEGDLEVHTEASPNQTSKTDPIWTAVDEVLQDVAIDEFKADSTQDNDSSTKDQNEAPNIEKSDTDHIKKVPDKPQFTIPTRILMRKMKKIMDSAETDSKYLYHVTRTVIQDRLTELMKGKEYTRSCLIVKMYREKYSDSDDEEFIKKIVADIYDGKYELLIMKLEIKNY